MDEEENIVNLTPLIDVLFVILIMFILVAPMVDVENVDLATKASTTNVVYPDENMEIKIQILKNKTIIFNKVPIQSSHLEYTCRNLKMQFPHAIPVVFCDTNAPFGLYQKVKNALEGAGFEQLQLALKSS